MKYLDTDAKERLEAICWAHAETSRRDVALILLALKTGARASELLSLKWSDFDGAVVSIKTLKGGRNREIPIGTKLMALIEPMRDGTSEKLFDISPQRLRQIWYHWRPVKMPFHSLRHTFGISLYRKTNKLNFVQECMGHKSLSSTSIYLQENYTMNEKKRLMGVK